MEELLEIYDENLNKIGIEKRSVIHQKGLLHAVCHLWITDLKNQSIYLQLRSMDKDSYPGYYDISSAGHIDAGELPLNAMLREAKEEIGINLKSQDVIFLGTIIEHFKNNHEITYIYTSDISNPNFNLGPEVIEMKKVSIQDFLNDSLDIPTVPHNTAVLKDYLISQLLKK